MKTVRSGGRFYLWGQRAQEAEGSIAQAVTWAGTYNYKT